MSVLSWFDGKQGPEFETARWVHGLMEERIRAGDVVGLAEQCAALKPVKGVFCGIMLAGFLGRDEVLKDAFEELQHAVRTMPHDVCERVFAIVERGNLPIHLSKRREQFEADRDRERASTTDAIRTRLATCEPALLVKEMAALVQNNKLAFDMQPRSIDQPELQELGLARLRELVSTLPDDDCWTLIEQIREVELTRPFVIYGRRLVDTKARAAEITRRRNLAAIASDAESEPRNAELEAAVAGNFEDTTGYEVLGDFLQRHGHPRGELIALQLRAENDPAVAEDARAHLEAHADAVLGSLAPHQRTHEPQPRPAFTWRRGFIDRILLAIESTDRPDDSTNADLLRRVFKHPAGGLIRGIDVTSSGRDGRILASIPERLIAVIAAERPRFVCDVAFDVMQRDQDSGHADIAPLWNMPALRSVRMDGINVDVGAIDHPTLEHAAFTACWLDRASVQAIARARWPRIAHLEIGLPEVELDDVSVLLARTDLPRLVYLALQDAPCTDDLCRLLTTSPLAAQLAQLDLSGGSMTDAGARTLARTPLPELETLDVSDNALSPDGVAVLKAAFRDVIAVGQADPDDD